MHTVAEHSPECVAAVIPVCRKHRDWCRQECDHFDADSEDRWVRVACALLCCIELLAIVCGECACHKSR